MDVGGNLSYLENPISDLINQEKFYRDCIKSLLEGLAIVDIDKFMLRLSPENCRKLGTAYYDNVLILVDALKILKKTKEELEHIEWT